MYKFSGTISKRVKERTMKKRTVNRVKKRVIKKRTVHDLQGIQVECKRCRILFDSDDALSYHRAHFHAKKIKKTFGCYLCKSSLVHKISLEWHMQSQHTGQSRFKCSKCSRNFVHKGHLQQHISTAHTKKSTLKCPKCRKTFFHRNVLKMHLAKQHGKGILFRCDWCKKSLINKQSLQWHMNSQHTGQSLLPCPECSKKFVHKRHLQKHTKSAHAKWVASKETKYPKKSPAKSKSRQENLTVLKYSFNNNLQSEKTTKNRRIWISQIIIVNFVISSHRKRDNQFDVSTFSIDLR